MMLPLELKLLILQFLDHRMEQIQSSMHKGRNHFHLDFYLQLLLFLFLLQLQEAFYLK